MIRVALILLFLSSAVLADELSSLARGERILSSREAGIWGVLSVSDGESGGQILGVKLDGRWREITAGGGAMGAGEYYSYGIPEKYWARLAGRAISARELEEVKELRKDGATAPDFRGVVLQASDLQGFKAWRLTILRNSIYAIHGYVFRDPMLAQYFSTRPWYHQNPRFSPASLSEGEAKNAEFIRKYQDQHGLNF